MEQIYVAPGYAKEVVRGKKEGKGKDKEERPSTELLLHRRKDCLVGQAKLICTENGFLYGRSKRRLHKSLYTPAVVTLFSAQTRLDVARAHMHV